MLLARCGLDSIAKSLFVMCVNVRSAGLHGNWTVCVLYQSDIH